MKSLKKLTLSLATAAIAMASAQAAPTIIHVVGSTAFRTGASIAIIDTLAGTTPTTTGTGKVYAASDSGTLASANRQVFANGTIGASGTATIIVETSWTGSLAGVVDLTAQSSTATFLDAQNITAVQTSVNGGQLNTTTDLYMSESPTTGVALSDTNTVTTGTITEIDLAMSDAVKSTISKELANATLTAPIGTYTTIGTLATATGGTTITDSGTSAYASAAGDVAVAPFEWLVSPNPTDSSSTTYTAPANINQQIARQLFTAGFVPQADFTGLNNSPDTSNYFYLVGRNEDSGTRIGSLSESQFGVTAPPLQYQVGDDATTTNPTLLYPAASGALNTEPNITWNTQGHSGYASGGNVATALGFVPPSTVTFTNGKPAKNTAYSAFIGYVGLTDAATAISKGATALSYNGVPYSPAAVQNGSYTFWIYEHAYRQATASGTILNTVNGIADNIYYNDADVIYGATGVSHAENQSTGAYASGSAGLFDDGYLNVTRSKTEGGPINHK